jgi:hypothetical protein
MKYVDGSKTKVRKTRSAEEIERAANWLKIAFVAMIVIISVLFHVL